MKSIALGAAAVFTAGMLAGCTLDIAPLFSEYENAELYQSGNFTYQAADVKEVEIDWIAGEVNIVQSAEETLSVSEKYVAKEDDERVHYYLEDSVLHIKFCASDFKGSINERDKKLTVEVPAGVYLEVNSVSSPVDLGTVNLSGISVINVSGNVEGGNLTANTVSVETVSGNIDFGEVYAAGMNLQSVSGNISVSIPNVMNAEIENISGNVELSLRQNLGTTLKVSVVSGKVISDLEYTQSGSRFHFYGGGTNSLRVDLVSGNLTVK